MDDGKEKSGATPQKEAPLTNYSPSENKSLTDYETLELVLSGRICALCHSNGSKKLTFVLHQQRKYKVCIGCIHACGSGAKVMQLLEQKYSHITNFTRVFDDA